MADIRDINFNGKKVLVRVDFNVPLDENGNITDDTRMRRALPTLSHILDNGGSLIIMSHLGRPQKKLTPEGKIDTDKFSLRHLVDHLEELLEVHVEFVNEPLGTAGKEVCESLHNGEVVLLENTRFDKGESAGDQEMGRALANLGDVFVNDAFGTAHRAHASTTTVATFFTKENKAFGFLMEEELKNGNQLMNEAVKPVTAIVGGAKVSDKIQLIENLMNFADNIIIGGGMSYTFYKSMGLSIGNSICEDEFVPLAAKLLKKASETNTKIYLPEDIKISDAFDNDANTKIVSKDAIPDEWLGLDIGPQAMADFREVLLNSKSILWNGPVGVFEMPTFAEGTNSLAQSIAEATEAGAHSLIGGGDSVSAIADAGLTDKMSFISTGGGAMLELLEGKTLPGVAAIEN